MKDLYKNMTTSTDNYWDFIDENLPGYSWRNDVLMSNTLVKFLEDEELEPHDAEMIRDEFHDNKQKAAEYLLELDKSLMAEAMDAYFAKRYGIAKPSK